MTSFYSKIYDKENQLRFRELFYEIYLLNGDLSLNIKFTVI